MRWLFRKVERYLSLIMILVQKLNIVCHYALRNILKKSALRITFKILSFRLLAQSKKYCSFVFTEAKRTIK